MDAVVSCIGKFAFNEFSTVKELHFAEGSEGTNSYNVAMVISSRKRSLKTALRLYFSDVSDLRITSFGGGLTQLSGLYIKDILARGWERKKWEIGDFENGAISFYAAEVTVSVEN
jgi:hypothetical protein